MKDADLGAHINGNALYNVGDVQFRRYVKRQIDISSSPAYDIAISAGFRGTYEFLILKDNNL